VTWGKVQFVGGGEIMCAPGKKIILTQARKIMPTVPSICGVNISIRQHCVGDILSEKEREE
jgi:hypothetical protein